MRAAEQGSYFLIVILLGALALAGIIFAPFLQPLALAAVFSTVLQGVYRRLRRYFGGRESLASLATVLASVVLVLLPLAILGTLLAAEARTLYLALESGGGRAIAAETIQRLNASLGREIPGLAAWLEGVSADIDLYAREALQWVASHAGDIFSGASRFLLSLFVFFMALYYLLRDGAAIRKTLIELSPLNDRDDESVFDRLELAVNSVIRGSLSVALIQGALSMIGLGIFGVPNPVLWGLLAALSALIPGLGTSLVFGPAVAYLFFTGSVPQAVGLLAWGALGVGLIDNFLGPRLVSSGMRLHPLLVLLSVLGGLVFFGPTGVFLGPLAISFLLAILSIYADRTRRDSAGSNAHPPASAS